MTGIKRQPDGNDPGAPGTGRTLRDSAEEQLAHSKRKTHVPDDQSTDELIHDLQVHQIELEMQAEELRRAHLALEESRDKYLDLYEFAPVGYLTLTEKGLIREANLTAAALLGADRRSLLNARFSKFVTERDGDNWHRYLLDVLKQEEKKTCTFRLRHGDGTTFPVRVESIRIVRVHQEPTILVALSDFTEHERGEERKRIFRRFMENAGDVILFVRQSDGRIIEANRKATEVYGFPPEELHAMTFFMLLPPDARNVIKPLMKEIGPSGILLETVHRRKGGSDIPVEINSFPIVWNGEPVLFSIIRDVTGRKQAETLWQLSADVLGILNEPGELKEIIRRVIIAIHQATNADAVGIRLQDGNDYPYLVQTGFSPEFLHKENSLLPANGGLCRDDGGKVSPACTCGLVIAGKTDPANPLFTPGGSAWTNNASTLLELPAADDPRCNPRNTCIHMGYASVAIIPIRKDPEEIIGTLQINTFRADGFTLDVIQSLELIAGQIGVALMRRQAEEALQQAGSEKGVLLAEVHHRVKNNLQIISGLLDMTRSRTADPATGAILLDMMLKIKTMAQIHTRLYESKQFDRINIGEQVRDQVSDLSSIYTRSGPEITCSIDAEEIFLPVDRAIPFALVINEVLSNAFKHAFKGRQSGTILVSLREENGRVLTRIEDDGVGIPAGVDVTRSTSLRLQLIRNLVLQLHGDLTLASSAQGFSVAIDFPASTGGT